MVATGSKERNDFLSTHPSPPKRIDALQALQQPMLKIYQERKDLYANYQPEYQYVKSHRDSAGFTSSNVRVVEEGKSSLLDAPALDSSKALAFYSEDYEAFKQGNLVMRCTGCAVNFYMNQKDLKTMHDQKDWRSLVQKLIKINYEFDLSYYYLTAAAKALGFKGASEA